MDKQVIDLNSKYKEKNKQQKIKKNDKNNIKKFKIWVVFLACLGLFTLVFLSHSSYFVVKNVKIVGNEYYSPEEVVEELDVKGENIIFFDKERLKGHLLKDRWVSSVDVETRLPDTIEINIVERLPGALYVDEKDSYFVLSKDLKVLERAKEPEDKLPYISGKGLKSPDNLEAGAMFSVKGLEKETKNKILSKMDVSVASLISEIYFDSDSKIVLYTNKGFPVKIGKPDDLGLKYHLLENIITEVEKLENNMEKYEHLDLRVPKYPVLQEKNEKK